MDVKDNNNSESSLHYYEAGECSQGSECPLKVIFDAKISPHQIARFGKDEVINHIKIYHNQYYPYILSSQRLFQISQTNNILDGIERKLNSYDAIPNEIKEREGLLPIRNSSTSRIKESHCPLCEEDYDHTQYIMPCCDNHCCLKCVEKKIKIENKCHFCGIKTDFLENFSLKGEEINKKSVNNKKYEKCNICFENLNETQYNAEYLIECDCNLGKGRVMCLSCAYNSLKDTKRVETFEIEGLPGVFRSNTIKVKGKCPYCRKEDIKNKDDIITIFECLPKRRK